VTSRWRSWTNVTWLRSSPTAAAAGTLLIAYESQLRVWPRDDVTDCRAPAAPLLTYLLTH